MRFGRDDSLEDLGIGKVTYHALAPGIQKLADHTRSRLYSLSIPWEGLLLRRPVH